MQAGGGIRGACFPSLHVVGAVVWSLASWRYEPRLGRLLTPIAAGVPISTVYLGYHHAVDAIAGIAIGPVLYRTATIMLRQRRGSSRVGHDPEASSDREPVSDFRKKDVFRLIAK